MELIQAFYCVLEFDAVSCLFGTVREQIASNSIDINSMLCIGVLCASILCSAE